MGIIAGASSGGAPQLSKSFQNYSLLNYLVRVGV